MLARPLYANPSPSPKIRAAKNMLCPEWAMTPNQKLRKYRLGRAKRSWIPETTRKSVVHFTCGEKPWLPGCDYEERKFFFEYLDRTEWAGWRVPLLKEVLGRLTRLFHDAKYTLGRLYLRMKVST